MPHGVSLLIPSWNLCHLSLNVLARCNILEEYLGGGVSGVWGMGCVGWGRARLLKREAGEPLPALLSLWWAEGGSGAVSCGAAAPAWWEAPEACSLRARCR